MPSYSRELTVLGLLGATLWLPQCSQLTKVDWNLIGPPGGASSSGGSSGTAGTSAGTTAGEAGVNSEAGEGGIGGAAGEAGAAGEPETGDTGGGGASAGFGANGGVGGNVAGSGGTLGGAGGGEPTAGSAGAHVLHPTCNVAPPTPTTAPDLTSKIVLFDGGPGTSGARCGASGHDCGRKGLDEACSTAKAALHLPGSEVHAVISVTPTDEIFDMPTNYKLPASSKPLVSPLGILVASSWNSLWSTGVAPSLVCTGVMPFGVRTWLTGTNKDKQQDPLNNMAAYYGTYSGTLGGENETCDSWSLSTLTSSVRAQVGSAIADSDSDIPPFFFNWYTTTCDAATDNVLCATYDP